SGCLLQGRARHKTGPPERRARRVRILPQIRGSYLERARDKETAQIGHHRPVLKPAVMVSDGDHQIVDVLFGSAHDWVAIALWPIVFPLLPFCGRRNSRSSTTRSMSAILSSRWAQPPKSDVLVRRIRPAPPRMLRPCGDTALRLVKRRTA